MMFKVGNDSFGYYGNSRDGCVEQVCLTLIVNLAFANT